MSELPKGWKEEKLGAICNIKTGNKNANQGSDDGEYAFFTCSQEVYKIKDYVFDGEAILIAGNGFFNVKYYHGKFDAYQRTYVLMDFSAHIKYVYYYIKYNLNIITADNRGSTIKYIRIGDLTGHVVHIPPTIEEQKRIVERLELLLGKINKANERLEKIPVILKRFRQSVLSSACSGKLTADWREENGGGEWENVELNNLIREIRIGPFGTLLHASDYVQNGVPVINPKNIMVQQIVPDYSKSITNETLERLSSYKIQNGDILIARRGEMGRTAPVTKKESGWLCGTGSMIIRLKEKYNPLLYSQLLSGQQVVMYLEMNCKGSTMKNLNEKIVKNIPLPAIPLHEQEEIVCRVDKLFALADRIQQKYKKAKAQLARAEKSIYAKAFRGELVRQEEQEVTIDKY